VTQADLYSMPFKAEYSDKVFAFGVLQHTPDVKRSFMTLIQFLKLGGQLAIDVYRKEKWPTRWTSKYLWRPITKRMPNFLLFPMVQWYVPRWLQFDNRLDELTFLGRFAEHIRGIVPCWNYRGTLPLTEEQIEAWAILDTFDALSPKYDHPQTIETVQSWFEEAKLADIEVRYGGNGILGCGTKPLL